jgi:chromatin modification-related protein VID21
MWRREALPLSKYVEGKMVLKFEGPPKKKSRFDYEEEDDDEEQVVFGEPGGQKNRILPPEKTDVALFNPEHKHIRERIHNSHQFRPPSEFPMPLQSFYEHRAPSQWTWSEDDDLKGLVREFSYNWSLISNILQPKSLYTSGAERRTPWECFERWIHLEGLPADMVKTHYFRAYTTRIESANRIVMAQAQLQAQQPNANGQLQPQARRRPTTSIRVERRRNQKHLTLVDAMRKLAKKRETNAQKQQHAQGMAAMRKANEQPQQAVNRNGVGHTPQDFSRMKAEREDAMRERLAEMQRRQEANRRLQRTAAQNPQQAGLPNGVPQQRAAGALAPNGTPVATGQNLTVPGQARPPRPMPPQMPGQPMPNGLRVPQPIINGVPQAPMQGQMPLPNPALDVGLVTRAHQISQHQQAILRQQQGQIPGQSPQMHNSPPRMNGMPAPGFPMPNGMMPPFNPNVSGASSSSPGGHVPSPGQAGSPRMGHNPLQYPNGVSHVQILEHQIKTKFPQATQEQVTRMISEQLAKSVHQQQQRQGIAQSAMNAAAGGAAMNGMGQAGQATPQLYAQMLRQQQENQQKAQQQAAAQAANAVANSGNGTGNAGQGHAHRGSSGSVQSGK